VSIFQYCFIRVFFTVVSVITQALDLYCLESLNPAFSHIWVMVFETISISVAMYCLIQFYVQIKDDIRQHKPLLKITAIKLVIFLSFWQTIAISFLTSAGAIKSTNHLQTPDIKVGIPAFLLCVEMAFFAVFHIWSFSWKPYTIGSREQMSEVVAGEGHSKAQYQGGFLGMKAIFDAFNGWDMLKATGRSARWLFKGRKTRLNDSSYNLNRKNTDGSDFDSQGQKLNNLNNPTSYTGGRASLPPYSAGVDEEGANLLANSQSMPTSHPTGFQAHTGYESHDASDIGLATSSYDDKYNGRYDPPHDPPQQSYRPYQSTTMNGQETGVTSLPYPTPQSGPQSRSHLGGPGEQIYMPPPRSPDPSLNRGPDGRQQQQGDGNFF
jgi:hypothetical protein